MDLDKVYPQYMKVLGWGGGGGGGDRASVSLKMSASLIWIIKFLHTII